MAAANKLFPTTALVLIFLLSATATTDEALGGGGGGGGGGGRVGGRRAVKDVESNKDVQNLGRYCVQQYNRQLQQQHNASTTKLLTFSQVVEAETQVVSGIKYYLKISAATDGGRPAKIFDAVVVVKPWLQDSKELIDFGPSTTSLTNTK